MLKQKQKQKGLHFFRLTITSAGGKKTNCTSLREMITKNISSINTIINLPCYTHFNFTHHFSFRLA